MAEKYVRITEGAYEAMVRKMKEIDNKATAASNKASTVENGLSSVNQSITTLNTFYNSFPANDNQTWGVLNRKAEAIAGAGYEILARKKETAVSLALLSLERRVLVVSPEDPLYEEVVALIPEDIMESFEAQPVQTTESKKVRKSDEQLLQDSITQYRLLLAMEKARQLEQAQSADNMALEEESDKEAELPKIGGSDVITDKTV